MITIRAESGQYFFSDFINLSNGKEATVDETLLTFRQLQSLSKAIKSKLILLSANDLKLLEESLLQKNATEETDICCGTPTPPSVIYTEDTPLPPYDHPLLVMKESKSNKVKSIVAGNDIQYPSTGAVINYVNNAVCHLLDKNDLYNYALRAELSCYVKKPELSPYATKAYVDAKVVATVDLTNYYTSVEVDSLLGGMVFPSLDEYSTTTEMDQAISTAILSAQLAGADVDLGDYLTTSEIEKKLLNYAEKADLEGLATETYVTTALSNFFAASPVELSEYAKKTEVESMVSGLVTQGELASELTAYVTSTELEGRIPKLDVVQTTVAPVLENSLPLYTLGSGGEYVLCTPDDWVDLGNGLVIPAYRRATVGLN